MLLRSILAIAASLIAAACSAQPETSVAEDDSVEAPLMLKAVDGANTGPGFRAELNKKRKNVGRRVLVIFETVEFTDEDGNKSDHTCPVAIRTVDSVCESAGYTTTDPSVVCRIPGQATPHPDKLDRIEWRAERGSDKFTVSFDFGQDADGNTTNVPCAGTWPPGFKNKHTCELASKDALGVVAGKAAYFKYNIIAEGENPDGCDLDPHFIVRH